MSAGIYAEHYSAPQAEALPAVPAAVLPTVSVVGTISYRIARGCLLFYVLGIGISVLFVATRDGAPGTLEGIVAFLIALGFGIGLVLNFVGFVLGFVGLFCRCERKLRTVWAMLLHSLAPATLLLMLVVVVVPRLAVGALGSQRTGATPVGTVNLEKIYTIVPNENDGWRETLYQDRNYAAVETQIVSLLAGPFDPMRSRELTSLYGRLANVEPGLAPEIMESVLDEWVAARPDAHSAFLVRGKFRIAQAWVIRGCTFADKVPKAAWPKFRAKIEEARADLERAYLLGPHDANAAATLITVAMVSKQDRAVMERCYQAALAACPLHMDAHGRKLNYLMPKWRGSFDDMFAYADELRSEGHDHPELWFYITSVYDELARMSRRAGDENLYAKEEVWSEIEAICRAYIERYPERLAMHFTLAYYANKAGQTDVELEQYEYIGDRWLEANPWRGLERYNAARATALWYGSQQHIQNGDFVAAQRMVEKSLQLEPGSFEARILLARIHLDGQGDLKAARAEVAAAATLAKTEQQQQDLQFAKSVVQLP